jgi:hypothetical protein
MTYIFGNVLPKGYEDYARVKLVFGWEQEKRVQLFDSFNNYSKNKGQAGTGNTCVYNSIF